jgi:hypothetical protein
MRNERMEAAQEKSRPRFARGRVEFESQAAKLGSLIQHADRELLAENRWRTWLITKGRNLTAD